MTLTIAALWAVPAALAGWVHGHSTGRARQVVVLTGPAVPPWTRLPALRRPITNSHGN